MACGWHYAISNITKKWSYIVSFNADLTTNSYNTHTSCINREIPFLLNFNIQVEHTVIASSHGVLNFCPLWFELFTETANRSNYTQTTDVETQTACIYVAMVLWRIFGCIGSLSTITS